MKKDYNIGLDIGTSSVGWSVVESGTQKIIKKGEKALWGVRLFDPASTAAERRSFRGTRRRYDRRRERIRLLQEEFKTEMDLIDNTFFMKLQNTKYNYKDDANNKNKFTKEELVQIRKYKEEYPTIYHLRRALIEKNEKFDIRLVYMAIHHIIKYRGNFLYEGKNFNVKSINLEEKLSNLLNLLSDEYYEPESQYDMESYVDIHELENAFFQTTKNDVKATLKSLLNFINPTFVTEFGKLMVGTKADILKMFNVEYSEKIEVSFLKNDFDEKYDKCLECLGDKIDIYNLIKEIYDGVFLKKVLGNDENISISNEMIKKYNTFEKDLKWLKEVFKNEKNMYKSFFKNDDCTYEKYLSGTLDSNELKNIIEKNIKKLVEDNKLSNSKLEEYKKDIFIRLESNTFMPKINSTDNGKYPYQLNESELMQILSNQGKYYPFLLNKTDDNTYKIVKLLEFKIPYYVGPLVSKNMSKNAWMIRTEEKGKITPYNFEKMIDKEKTAIEFIKRMSSHCSYLLDEYALPNNSIIYSEYKVRNELKQIKVNDRRLTVDDQNLIFEELFKKTPGNITERIFKNYLKSNKLFPMYTNLDITGYSALEKFANNMQSYIDFFGDEGIFENTDYNLDDAEQIIEWITIFEDKSILETKIRKDYPKLTENQVKLVISKSYKGWGSLSKKMLTTKYYKDKYTEVYKSIMDLLIETKENFMQIINNKEYNFQQMIKNYNNNLNEKMTNHELVDKLATSPANKKGIYQSLKLVKEITDVMGYNPKNIIVEMARNDGKKERIKDRKSMLQELYKKCKEQISDYKRLKSELDNHEITTEKLFLYFIQEGKCLYSGEPLKLENIEDVSLYEVDHILPRSLIKDDSIDNKALVLRKCNQTKKDSFVVPKEYRTKQIEWWKRLYAIGLISSKKYHNLIRNEYNQEELDSFINRQLVETRQIIKHVANILENTYTNTKILYPKANLSHSYRERYELYKFRDINDYHHAHDAYLAAVLGEYAETYMKKTFDFSQIKEINKRIYELQAQDTIKYGYIVNSLDERLSDLIIKMSKNMTNAETGEVIFDSKKFNETIAKNLYRNDIIISRKTEIRSGQLYKQKIYKKKVGTIPIKENMPIDLYGGYSNNECKYLMLISYKEDKRKIIGIPMNIASLKDQTITDNYIRKQLKLKENENYSILKDKIPFDSEIVYKNQHVYIKGYSVQKHTCELSNAHELKIKKDLLYSWRFALNYIINDKNQYEDEARKFIVDIYNFLMAVPDYPLFKNIISKIKLILQFDNLDLQGQKKIIIELFKLYSCSSVNANLKEFGLGDRLGRLTGCSITDGKIISKSITGLKETISSINEG